MVTRPLPYNEYMSNTTVIRLTNRIAMRFVLLKKQQYLRWISQAPSVAEPELPEGYDHETAVRTPGYYQDAYNKAAAERSQNEIWICLGLSCHPDSVIDYADMGSEEVADLVSHVERCEQELIDFCKRREIELPSRKLNGQNLVVRGRMVAELAESGDCMEDVLTFRDKILFDVFGFVRQEVVAEAMKSEAPEGERNGPDADRGANPEKTRNAKGRVQRSAQR
jgi:hypothetical protein